jgi:hypothetical protein
MRGGSRLIWPRDGCIVTVASSWRYGGDTLTYQSDLSIKGSHGQHNLQNTHRSAAAIG